MRIKGVGLMALALAFTLASGAAFAADEVKGDPYPLDHCFMSGKPLPEGGDAVSTVYEGRQVKFCCNGCKSKFEADPTAALSKLDTEIVEQQKSRYPLKTCVVSGEAIKDGEGVDFVYNNRYMHLCCAGCEKKIKADPARYIGDVDAAVIKSQEGSYAVKTCPVSGEEIGSMGEPVKMVVANQLIELCCKGCKKKVDADPAKYLSKVEPK